MYTLRLFKYKDDDLGIEFLKDDSHSYEDDIILCEKSDIVLKAIEILMRWKNEQL